MIGKGCWTRELIQPIGMMIASSLNLCGASLALMLSDRERNNPFYYTAMTTSAIYMTANATKIYQVCCDESRKFRDAELARRDVDLELKEIVIER